MLYSFVVCSVSYHITVELFQLVWIKVYWLLCRTLESIMAPLPKDVIAGLKGKPFWPLFTRRLRVRHFSCAEQVLTLLSAGIQSSVKLPSDRVCHCVIV